jgi:hypothetical protein
MHHAHTRTFIAGVTGTTVVGGVAVFVDSSGQLGTMASSARFKNEIKPMDKASEEIFALRPVTFRYKSGPNATAQFGLVAEEVVEVNPDLVVRDNEGKPYTVRYDQVNAMLLNEFLKEHRKVEDQQTKIETQQATIVEMKSTIARKEKGIEVLTAQLKEQAAQIQKVSTQLEITKSGGRLVTNER